MLRQYRARVFAQKQQGQHDPVSQYYQQHHHYHKGRGGAGPGNMSSSTDSASSELYVPMVKGQLYDSSRGDSGSVAKFEPDYPRESESFHEMPVVRSSKATELCDAKGAASGGQKPSPSELLAARVEAAKWNTLANKGDAAEAHLKKDYHLGWADKGKQLLFRRRK
ncbi:MAG: hypothetical protein M1832_000410 [Thelocarpon impressellum]|nr:MAG: hypothetical protein M1832_000410 [Thelocarpon impressellum]